MSDVPSTRRRDQVSLDGIPSAMNELQLRQLIRDLGNIEKKGLQLRASHMEAAKVYDHLTQIMIANAISETKVRDIAKEELTQEEYEQFDRDLKDLHGVNHEWHRRYLETGLSQFHDNIRRQPLTSAQENALDSFFDGFSQPFKKIGIGPKK